MCATTITTLAVDTIVILAKRYKLREREKHIDIQAIVEEHYERYFDQEEEYMREAAANYQWRNYSPCAYTLLACSLNSLKTSTVTLSIIINNFH